MPSYNISLQDFSPLIVYSREWQAFGNEDAEEVPIVANYSGVSFATTSSIGASYTLSFWGTGVYLEGAKRPSYGSFNVTLDGQTSIVNASRSRDIFQTALYSASGLTPAQHTITTACTGDAFDIDFIKLTSGDGDESTSNDETTFDDGDSLMAYFPSETDWQTTVSRQRDYFNNTAHQTESSAARVRISFSGNTIEVYGSVGADNSVFIVQIDSDDPITLNGTSTQYHKPSVPIFIAGGLASRSHTLWINNTGGGLFDIDKVVNSSWSSSSTGDLSSSSESPSSRTGVIVGSVVGVLACLILAALAFFFVRGKRRRRGFARTARTDSFDLAPGVTEESRNPFSHVVSPYIFTGDEQQLRPFVPELPGNVGDSSIDKASLSVKDNSAAGGTEVIFPPVQPSLVGGENRLLGENDCSRARNVIQETDAGPLLTSNNNAPEHLPPAYDQYVGTI